MPRVLIIGAGIGGLAAAVAFRRKGWDAAVYEAAPEFRPVGKGIWVPINAVTVLARLGLADPVAHAGWPLDRIEIHAATGVPLAAIDLRPLVSRHGCGTVSVHRATLVGILAAALPPEAFHLGKRLAGFAQTPAGVIAHFEDGTEAAGDLLVGGDGIRSAVRGQLFPGVPLRYSGQTCYHGLVEADLPAELLHTCREVWGGRYRFGFTATGPREVYWFAPVSAPAGAVDRGVVAAGHLKAWYADFPHPVPELIARVRPDDILLTELHDFEPIPSWHAGRVVLLGDAAHAMVPNLGQGGAQAIEDAYVLAESVCGGRELPDALDEYERVRMPKAAAIVNAAWQLGQMSHWQRPAARWLRDRAMRCTPERVSRAMLDRLYRLNY